MQRIILISIFFIFIANCKAQPSIQTGDWQWRYQNKHQTIFSIENVDDTTIVFNYCSVYFDGQKIDCNQDRQFELYSVNTYEYEGVFHSDFSDFSIELKIIFNSDFTEFETRLLNQPDGEFYFPDGAKFKNI